MTLSRRTLLKSTLSTVALFGAAGAFGRVQEICSRTPPQPEGPFYPVQDQFDKNNDLTLVEGRSGAAIGTVIYVHGVVSDANCNPIESAVVEIWQACASGRYNHPGDQENQNALDPNFQYWGINATNQLGEYTFKTVLPGHYNADVNWIRPPHIHFKVHRRGYHELTTQMYFVGNKYNNDDLILRRLSSADRESVVVTMVERPASSPQKEYDCVFHITLLKVT